MKIACLLPDFRAGGAESMRLRLATELSKRDHQFEFWLLKQQGELLAKAGQFPILDLGVTRIRRLFRPLARVLKERQPDLLIVDMWPNTVVAATVFRLFGHSFRRTKLLVCEQNTLGSKPEVAGRIRRGLVGASIRLSYPWASGILAVSEGVASDLVRLSGLHRNQIDVIHNPGLVTDILEADSDPWPNERPRIVCVGSLKRQKNHALAIDAFSGLGVAGAVLAILGDGPLQETLAMQVKALGIESRVILPGHCDDVRAWLKHADIFLMTSDWEGSPVAIAEALQSGLQVVSTDCPSGPAELLQDGNFGWLASCGDIAQVRHGIKQALIDPIDREQILSRAKEFSVSKISDDYESLLERLSLVRTAK